MISDFRTQRAKAFLERAPRHPYHKTMIVSSFGSLQRYKPLCLNISNTGYLIEGVDMPFKIGSLIELYLDQNGKKIKLAGKIARVQFFDHSEKVQYGIQLSFVDGEEYNIWKDFVTNHNNNHPSLPPQQPPLKE